MESYRRWIVFYCTLSLTLSTALENETRSGDQVTLIGSNKTVSRDSGGRSTPIPGLKPTVKEKCPINNCTNYSANNSSWIGDRVIDRACNCDEKCVDYRDCCVDSKYYNTNEQRQRSLYECRAYGMENFFVKAACPPSWNDRAVRENCTVSRKHANLNTENVELGIPVTSLTTNFTYANAYCAICNSEHHFKLWKVEVKYDCGLKNYHFNTRTCKNIKNSTINGLQFDGNRWYFMYNDAAQYSVLNLTPPRDIQYERCKTAIMINSCPKTWPDSEIEEKCDGPYLRVSDMGHFRVYKNKYCAICNGVNEKNVSCIVAVWTPGFAPSFTALFDFEFANPINLCYRNHASLSEQTCVIKGVANQTPASEMENWLFNAYTSMAVSASLVFLIIHLIIFSFVEELRTVGGKNMASYCIALTLAYGTFLVGNFVKGVTCVIVAILMYYLFLCAFTWMLIISYDLWRTFWNVTKHYQSPSNPKKTFFSYSLFCWSAPLVPVSIALYLHYSEIASSFAPHFGEKGDACWFQNGYSLLIFFVAPVCLIITINFAFFLHTSIMVHSSRCQSVNRRSKTDFKIFARIALLTGITWITGFIGGYTQQLAIWLIFIVLNTSQGLFIFIAFSCKRQIFLSFLKRVGACANLQIMLQESITKSTKLKTTTNAAPKVT